jgi:hypothetical protein
MVFNILIIVSVQINELTVFISSRKPRDIGTLKKRLNIVVRCFTNWNVGNNEEKKHYHYE